MGKPFLQVGQRRCIGCFLDTSQNASGKADVIGISLG
jgi:hypothetical protein